MVVLVEEEVVMAMIVVWVAPVAVIQVVAAVDLRVARVLVVAVVHTTEAPAKPKQRVTRLEMERLL
jgi:hypothetical protein